MSFDLNNIIRPKILNLKPYCCARDDFKEGILLDANENAYGPMLGGLDADSSRLHRYPDPHQNELRQLMANYRNTKCGLEINQMIKEPLTADNICLGVGSDESIDYIMRATCIPGISKIMLMPPTYGMYSISAEINDVECIAFPLDHKTFQFDPYKVLALLNNDKNIKLVFITSPGNPTGRSIEINRIQKLLEGWQNGLVIVDEAYVEFSSIQSMAPLVNTYPNLVVLQTFSKSFGLAGIRLGSTFASKEIARVLNAMKAPYNISQMTSALAIEAFSPESLRKLNMTIDLIASERLRVAKALTALDYIDDDYVGGLDANFILIRVKNGDNELAKSLYKQLATRSKVITRYRGNEPGCKGCIRVTIGTPRENDTLISELTKTLLELTTEV